MHQLNGKEIDYSMENMPGITNGHQKHEKYLHFSVFFPVTQIVLE